MHHPPQHERVMREWCEATGTTPWPPGEFASFAVRDVDVGLLFQVDARGETLHIVAHLGLLASPAVHEHLLRLNSDLGLADHGVYALQPDSEAVLYRMAVALNEDTDGAALPHVIANRFDEARVRAIF